MAMAAVFTSKYCLCLCVVWVIAMGVCNKAPSGAAVPESACPSADSLTANASGLSSPQHCSAFPNLFCVHSSASSSKPHVPSFGGEASSHAFHISGEAHSLCQHPASLSLPL